MKKLVLAAAALFAAGLLTPAFAEELKVMTGAGLTEPVRAIAAGFGRDTGIAVTVISDTTGGVQKRLEGGEKADLVLVTTTVMNTLTKENLVEAEHTDLARVMVGIAVKRGAAEPDISSPDAVKQALLAAKSVAYVDPAVGGITGPFFVGLCQKLGIADQIAAKAVLRKTGGEVAAAVASGDAALGVTLVSEMLPNAGVSVAGPLPREIQIDTIYTAALAKGAANPGAAKKFLDALRAPKGQISIRESGLVTIVQ